MEKSQVKWTVNKNWSPDYRKNELSVLSDTSIEKVLEFQRTHPSYQHTPLVSLDHLADYLNVSGIKVKDEASRFGLNAFKVMGGIYAIGNYLATQLGRDIATVSFKELQSNEVKAKIGKKTFITATDGNHGRGIAWAARELGQESVVYMPKGSTEERLKAIKSEGATAEITELNYDDTVRMCAEIAEENNWVLIQDTAWEGYDRVPLWIMQGYAGIAMEIVDEIEANNGKQPTHIILQAGVGSFAAAIAGYFRQHYRDNPPKIIVVEPDKADCYYRSFANETGERTIVSGHMDSIMAGLCCGEPSIQAFQILNHEALAAFSCDDSLAALGMRVLANPIDGDEKIIAGESGAIPLGLLFYLRAHERKEICASLDLHESSNVLIINTEGATDYEQYADIVWKGHYPNT